MQTVRELVLYLKNKFKQDFEKYNDSIVLLASALDSSKEKLIAFDELQLTAQQLENFEKMLLRLQQGEPVAYILAYKEFWSLPFMVNSNCLIPRADTECLVEWVLANFAQDTQIKALDLGTGSGAIACALAHERAGWDLTAVDNSPAALQVAQENAHSLQLANIKFVLSDLFAGLSGQKFDLIISNPPYIAADDEHLAALEFEPTQALVAKQDGYADLFAIIDSAQKFLTAGGALVLEHGYQQADVLMARLGAANYHNIQSHCDYAARPRFVTAYKDCL